MDTASLLPVLRRLGLTQYEANCYVQLVMLGPSDPRRIAAKARIPYPNAYESLKRLKDRGWVEIIRKRPATYIAKRPDLVKQEIISEVDDVFSKLESLYRTIPSEDTELVFTIRDKKKVVSKIYELLSEAREKVIVVGPGISFAEANLAETLDKIARRGIKVRVISDIDVVSSLPEGIEARVGMLVAFDLLVDERVAMIALPDLSACGWADSDAVAKHFLQFLELMWINSKERI
ncbi:MAG: helix-turn-helix domain-containing protein [Conexivisphaerales archaeon]